MRAIPEEAKIVERGRAIIRQEAQALLEAADYLDERFAQAVLRLFRCRGRIVVTGVGKAGLVGRKISATFASTGAPSVFLHPADGLHGDLGMVTPDDVVLALSNRGQSDDVLRIIPYLKHYRIDLVAMTSNESSELARHADYLVLIPRLREACPHGLAPTSSSTAMLAVGDAIAIVLLELHGFDESQFALVHPSGALGKRLLTRVADVLPPDGANPVIRQGESFKQLLIEMTASNRGAVSVTDDEGRLVGIVTDGDIKRILTRSGYRMTMTVGEIMTHDPVTTRMDALAVRALAQMEKRRTTVLPVVDDRGAPLALVHIHDLIRAGITS
jgi:arabinose-5-phosphate isomerase